MTDSVQFKPVRFEIHHCRCPHLHFNRRCICVSWEDTCHGGKNQI